MKTKKEIVLLSRDAFREGVFDRDGHKCVFCGEPAVDAHHIIERRLWPDGGYYLANGASVCQEHHLACERTTISVDQVREACGIRTLLVPPHLYPDQPYDKWGNPLLSNGQRVKGELFFDESVQKVLGEGGVLADFTNRVKYPRTHHLPWSPGIHADDRVIASLAAFEGRNVVVTTKMDGENTTIYHDNYLHARSVDGRSHPSRDWVKQFASTFAHDIPVGWRVVGENAYAVHSISYSSLPSYFLGFSIWDDRNVCRGWDETMEWFELLGVTPVPVLYRGVYNEKVIRSLWKESDRDTCEGYVMRVMDPISYGDFRHAVAKFVRKGHVQTVKHWMHGQPITANKLAAAA